MHRELVRYDQWHFIKVDPVRLKRVAMILRDQINQKIKTDNDIYLFHTLTMPVVEAAIRGEIIQSLSGTTDNFISGNFDHDRSEGTLPPEYDREFTKAVAGFAVTVQGLSLEAVDKFVLDGVTYGWVEFEDLGDWPSRVEYF